MKKDFSNQFSVEFNETNFKNSCFSWEFNFVSCKIFSVRKNLLSYSLLHILCSKAVTRK